MRQVGRPQVQKMGMMEEHGVGDGHGARVVGMVCVGHGAGLCGAYGHTIAGSHEHGNIY
jgi:hypothetical protein